MLRFPRAIPAVYQALRYLECDPDIAASRPNTSPLRSRPFRSDHRIAQDGVVMRQQITPRGVSETLHAELTITVARRFSQCAAGPRGLAPLRPAQDFPGRSQGRRQDDPHAASHSRRLCD